MENSNSSVSNENYEPINATSSSGQSLSGGNIWEDIPLEIYSEILSFLPVLPNYFRLSRVCKAWKEIFYFLMNDYFEYSAFHLDFSEVDPYQMQYTDLLKIITNCRGVKKITLHFMQVTPEILKVIGRTSVETLIISNCEVKNELEGDDYFERDLFRRNLYLHYNRSIMLDFYPFEDSIDGHNPYLKQLQKFSKEFKLSKQTKYFEYLKTVVFLDTPFYSLTPINFSNESSPLSFDSYPKTHCSFEYFDIPNFENLDIDNIVAKPHSNGSSSISTFNGLFSSITENNPKKMLALKCKDRLVNILCIASGSIQTQTVVFGRAIDFIRIDPINHEKCYQFFMRNKLPFNLKTRVSFVSSCKDLKVYRKFVEAGYIKLLDTDICGKTVLFEALDRAYASSPGFTDQRPHFVYSFWRDSLEINSLIDTIKWIHGNTDILAQFDMNGKIFKEYALICKNMDKRWKNYYSKFKIDMSNKIDWEHFIKTGEEKAPPKKRKQSSTSMADDVSNRSKKSK